MCEWIGEHLIWDVKQRSCRIDFFLKPKLVPAKIPIPLEIFQNWLEWSKHPKIGQNLTWGGMGSSTILDCTLTWEIPVVRIETEWN